MTEQLNVRLDESRRKRLRLLAALRQQSITEVVAGALDHELEAAPERAAIESMIELTEQG